MNGFTSPILPGAQSPVTGIANPMGVAYQVTIANVCHINILSSYWSNQFTIIWFGALPTSTRLYGNEDLMFLWS